MIHAATIAVVGEVPLDRLWHAVPSYPTMSEVWLRLLEDLRTLVSHLLRRSGHGKKILA